MLEEGKSAPVCSSRKREFHGSAEMLTVADPNSQLHSHGHGISADYSCSLQPQLHVLLVNLTALGFSGAGPYNQLDC
jgi:hypothetical protein